VADHSMADYRYLSVMFLLAWHLDFCDYFSLKNNIFKDGVLQALLSLFLAP